jgi:sucrose-6-phosphate hydrolase SacC (GH32 family)
LIALRLIHASAMLWRLPEVISDSDVKRAEACAPDRGVHAASASNSIEIQVPSGNHYWHSQYLNTMSQMKTPILLAAIFASLSLFGADGGFLFATFKGEQTHMTEQIYFALSKDGRQWTALKGGEPVLVSELGEKGVRDPYLLRSHDGKKFFLLATDLSINLTRHNWGRAVRSGSKSLVIWDSTDLVNWSQPRLVKVAPDDAGCTWAPEAVYDQATGDYMTFWASTTGRDEFKKHRIWAARTKDFVTFGEPFIYIERPVPIIDTTIINENGMYYRFSKDEEFKSITMQSSTNLMTGWKDMDEFSMAKVKGYEGPECYQVEPAKDGKPATWCLILDQYSKGTGYHPFITTNLGSGQFTPGTDFSFPFRFRHGSILPISTVEYQALEQAYGVKR